MGLGESGVQSQSGVKAGDGAIELPQSVKGQSQIVVIFGDGGVYGDGLGNQLNGGIVTADLMGQEAQQAEGVGMAGIVGQHGAIELLCGRELAGLMKANGLGKGDEGIVGG